jgi:broad specificity phosphatase PhoE
VTCVFLVRHGATDFLGRAIAGRKPGVSLNADGRAQAERLVRFFKTEAIAGIRCSPLVRARETAEPIAQHLGLDIQIAPALNETDFGEWTGMPLDELAQRRDWQHWNELRSNTRAPGGETMLEVQARVVGYIQYLGAAENEGGYILVGHADPIKSALLYFLGAPMDFMPRLEISPASISAVVVGRNEPRLLFVNETLMN